MKRVLCYGDSLTAGYKEMGLSFHPYAGRLKALLGASYEVEHVGLCGWTTIQMHDALDAGRSEDVCGKNWGAGLRARLQDAARRGEPVDVVCILAGTNDLGDVLQGSSSVERVCGALAALHSAARDAGCATIAMTVPEHGQEGMFAELRVVRETINAWIKSQHAFISSTVDIAAGLPQARRELWDDSLHFSTLGYDTLAELLYAGGSAVFRG